MDIFRRRMSLKELPILNKGYASSPTMTRTKSTSSSNNKKYLPFRQRSGSINPASFLKGRNSSISSDSKQGVRERAYTTGVKNSSLTKVPRNAGLVESSSLECPSPRQGRSYSSASSMPSQPTPIMRKYGTSTKSNSPRREAPGKSNTDFLTSPWSSLESFYDLEDDAGTPKEEVLCLMPTGIILDISVHPDNVISNIKELAIDTAKNSDSVPLRGCINPDVRKYSISYVTQQGIRQEMTRQDETKTLRQLKPFKNVLKFGLKSKNKELYLFKKHIGKLISKDLEEYDKMHNCEVNDFRWKIKAFANNLAQKRKTRLESSWQERMSYQYPQRFVKFDPSHMKYLMPRKMSNDPDDLSYNVKIVSGDDCTIIKELEVGLNETAEDVLQRVCNDFEDSDVDDCCLKTLNEDSYIFGTRKLVEFAYIHDHISSSATPALILVKVNSDLLEKVVEKVGDSVYVMLDKDMKLSHAETAETSMIPAASTSPDISTNLDFYRQNSSAIYARDINQPFSVFVEDLNLTSYLSQLPKVSGPQNVIGLQLGLFHGAKRLCPTITLSPTIKLPSNNNTFVFSIEKPFEFDILLSQLPRMTKLCIGVFTCIKSGWSNTTQPLYWVNAQIFDYRGILQSRDTLHLWKYSLGDVMPTHEGNLSPLRHTVSNPDREDAPNLIFQCCPDLSLSGEKGSVPKRLSNTTCGSSSEKVAEKPQRIEFKEATPSSNMGEVPDDAVLLSGQTLKGSHDKSKFDNVVAKLYLQELNLIADRDPLHDITEQDKDLIWKVRYFCCSFLPQLLPRIIDCVDYSNPQQVQQLHALLAKWPALPVECAFQLLDYAYPDTLVRAFAVKCLRKNATDNCVLLYMLQLCQALKHEAYLMSDLVEFLLERALNNQHIGHFLFWELRADMNKKSSAASLLYGLLLEAYLIAAPEHEIILEHQLTLLEKCKATSLDINKVEIVSRSHQKAKHRFAAAIKSQFYGYHPYRNFVNPLNPNQKCKRILLDKCKLMNSKMRPQLLTFENASTLNNMRSSINISGRSSSPYETDWIEIENPNVVNDIRIMFKKGDDLRQDKLTLQLLTVIDRVWKEAGLDLRMTLYKCVATDVNEGLLEVVQKAETVCKIQMRTGITPTSAVFKKGLLMSWLKHHNPTIADRAKAQEQFTLSCAGYSVAAYVLGIGDRHNDNIMVKTSGQMFHIDFGHFLGNFKYKFGIRRERVPILLSNEFIEVIKTDEFGRQRNFENFRNLCERAYLTLRRNGCLLISLLAMMISTGLPELSSEQDVNIVRSTLNLDRSEEEALENFKHEFDESLRNAWKISLDWWFHMMNQARTNRAT